MDKRAVRRHHIKRLKKARRYYMCALHRRDNPKFIGILANTAALCSCYMCGNPRRMWGQISLDEMISNQDFDDQMKEL